LSTITSDILKEFYYESPQSIASISNRTKKSIPLITKGVQQLLSQGFVKDQGLAQSNGGRRANLFALDADKLPHVLLLAIDQHKVTIGLYDFSNTEIKANEVIPICLHKNESSINQLLTAMDNYLLAVNQSKIIAISISMPGFVNTELGINTSYSNTDKRCQIRDIIEKKYNKETFIENDSTAIAIAEHKFGIGKGIHNVLVINLNWGVGLGMIIDNKLFKGSSGFAGEFSHIPLSNLKKLCSCGKRGCLEVEASLEAVISYALTQIKNGETSILTNKIDKNNSLDINDILVAANNGDQLAISSFRNIGYALGKGIATLIHIINPEKIIVSGYGIYIQQIIKPPIQSALIEYSIRRLSEKTEVQISHLENVQLIGTMASAVAHLDWNRVLQ